MSRRALGLGLLVVGVILLVFGFQAHDSIGSAFSKAFGEGPTDETLWFLLGGAAAAVIGLFLAAMPARRAT
jgi:hypothetical protein